VPLAFHLGFHSLPVGNVMPGFGGVGMGGSVGWAELADGVAFALAHNRLLTPFVKPAADTVCDDRSRRVRRNL
jgi:CubicO group peptidase (beta-lactamase class C family)